MLKIMIISKYADNISRIKKIINNQEFKVVGENTDEIKALDDAEIKDPDVVIFSFSGGDNTMLNAANRMITYRPKTFVITLFDDVTEATYSTCLKFGVYNIFKMPETERELTDSINAVYTRESQRIEAINGKNSISYNSQILGFYSPKSGVGKTTIAVNVAATIAKTNRSVCLIDLDAEFGDVAWYLNLNPKNTIAELLQDTSNPTIAEIENYMMVHPSGMHVLCAPKTSEYAELVTTDKIVPLLNTIKTYYDFVIVDLPNSIIGDKTELFKYMNLIYFVVTMENAVIKNAKTALNILDTLQEKDKVRIIVGRETPYDSVKFEDIHKITNCKIIAAVPSQYQYAVGAVNRGQPVTEIYPNTKMSEAIINIANVIQSRNVDIDIWNMSKTEIKQTYEEAKRRSLGLRPDETIKKENKKWGFWKH